MGIVAPGEKRSSENNVVTLFIILVMNQALTDKFNWTAF